MNVDLWLFRKSGSYEDWGLHVWGNVDKPTEWHRPLAPTGKDKYGVYWDVNSLMKGDFHFVVHQGDAKV